jgi:hypothetical protein
MRVSFLIMAVLLFAATGTAGEVVKWVDERGVVHFTDNAASVPEKYRQGIDRRELPEERETPSGSTQEVTEGPRDRSGRGEDYWMNRTNESKGQLDQAQKEYRKVMLEYNELIAAYNATNSRAKRKQYQREIKSIQAKLETHRKDVERAKEMLEKTLPEEAARAGAPAEWVK